MHFSAILVIPVTHFIRKSVIPLINNVQTRSLTNETSANHTSIFLMGSPLFLYYGIFIYRGNLIFFSCYC